MSSEGVHKHNLFTDMRYTNDIPNYKLCLLAYHDMGRNYGGIVAFHFQNNSY